MVINENNLNRLLDNVENSLENFVLENKAKCENWVRMESLLVTQYTTQVDNTLQSTKYTSLNQLETKYRFIISNRLKDFLVLAKEKYDKN